MMQLTVYRSGTSIGGVWFSCLEGLKISMGAEGAKIEAPSAPRGWGLGGGSPQKIIFELFLYKRAL